LAEGEKEGIIQVAQPAGQADISMEPYESRNAHLHKLISRYQRQKSHLDLIGLNRKYPLKRRIRHMILPSSFVEQRRIGIGTSRALYRYHMLASICYQFPLVSISYQGKCTWSKKRMMYPNIDQLDRFEARYIWANRRRRE
jgi:hypothetical protein